MRIVRTELYFNLTGSGHDESDSNKNPGISISWFAADGPHQQFERDQLKLDHFIQREFDINLIRTFLDVAIENLEWSGDARLFNIRDRVRHQDIVEFILNADVVVERSPPTAEPFRMLLKGSSSVVIGTYLGFGLASGSFPLMLLTVPAGIIVVGSAIGVSQGLQNGLNKAIERAIAGRRRR